MSAVLDVLSILVMLFLMSAVYALLRELNKARKLVSYQQKRFTLANRTIMAVREHAYSIAYVHAHDSQNYREEIENEMTRYHAEMRELSDRFYPVA